jgi:hypothetical protein
MKLVASARLKLMGAPVSSEPLHLSGAYCKWWHFMVPGNVLAKLI